MMTQSVRYKSASPDDSREFVSTAEYRKPKAGEWFREHEPANPYSFTGRAVLATADGAREAFILAPVPDRTTEVARPNPHLDDTDLVILELRAAKFSAYADARVGEYVLMKDEAAPRRFTHDWGDVIQTTCGPSHPCFGDTRFYLCEGAASFSGSLAPSIPKSTLTLTDEKRAAGFWFFHHNEARAHNGMDVRLPVRIWRQA
jgi:hypothetical protein